MYWLIGKKEDPKGVNTLFYEYFTLETNPTWKDTTAAYWKDLKIEMVAASSEEAFLLYYAQHKNI